MCNWNNVGNFIPVFYNDFGFAIIFTVVQFSIDSTNGFTLYAGTVVKDKDRQRDISIRASSQVGIKLEINFKAKFFKENKIFMVPTSHFSKTN